tara:strand:- start:3485 stop:3850 length:366 start_codon:yes stop_codon:yes gene_type:complete
MNKSLVIGVLVKCWIESYPASLLIHGKPCEIDFEGQGEPMLTVPKSLENDEFVQQLVKGFEEKGSAKAAVRDDNDSHITVNGNLTMILDSGKRIKSETTVLMLDCDSIDFIGYGAFSNTGN